MIVVERELNFSISDMDVIEGLFNKINFDDPEGQKLIDRIVEFSAEDYDIQQWDNKIYELSKRAHDAEALLNKFVVLRNKILGVIELKKKQEQEEKATKINTNKTFEKILLLNNFRSLHCNNVNCIDCAFRDIGTCMVSKFIHDNCED